MGKWTHLRGQYPEFKIAMVDLKEKVKLVPVDELETKVAELYLKKKRLEREKAVAENEYQAAQEVLLEHWKIKKTSQIKRDDLGTLTRTDDVHVTVKDEEALFKWLDENHLSNIKKTTVHHQTLNSTVKELLENGNPLPEGIKIFVKSNVRVTTPKGDPNE